MKIEQIVEEIEKEYKKLREEHPLREVTDYARKIADIPRPYSVTNLQHFSQAFLNVIKKLSPKDSVLETEKEEASPVSISSEEEEVWKTKEYLAGVIDSEGSFPVHVVRGRELYYLSHEFTITVLGTREWVSTADYLKSLYGGHTRISHRFYYEWRLSETEPLIRFLNDIIPHLGIKRTDAERMRTSLLAYKEIVDRGRPTPEQWDEWLTKFRLREEFRPLVVS